MKYAVTDIGSNTIRLTIYEMKDGHPQVLMKKKSQAGLADYIDQSVMSEEGIWRLIRVLNSFQGIYRFFQVDNNFLFATAAVRNAKNKNTILAKVKEATGLSIDLISGPMEAELGYLGVQSSFNLDTGVHVDIGGGSTEILIHKKGQILYKNSLDEGSLSLYRSNVERIFPTKEEVRAIRVLMREKLQDLDMDLENIPYQIVGVGGTIRACNNLCGDLFGREEISYNADSEDHQGVFSMAEVKQVVKGLRKFDPLYVRSILHICPSRIHTITPGMIILQEVARVFHCKEIFVSNRGVREGYLLWRLNHEGK